MSMVMQRGMSASPVGGRTANRNNSYDENSRLPPWEQRNVVQVPYMDTKSPQLVQAERQPMWASKQSGRPGLNTTPQNQAYRDYISPPISPEEGVNPWRTHRPAIPAPPLTAPPPPAPAAPYESVRIPQGPKSAPSLPSFVKAPPTPPESFNLSRSSTKSSTHKPRSYDAPLPPPPAPPVPVTTSLPGTMSTRERSHSRSRSRHGRSDRDRRYEDDKASESNKGFGKRFKAAFKDMFKREPIDESKFERISDRHWTDE